MRASATGLRASWYFANNEPDEALPYAEQAMELANALGNTSLATMARFALGGALMERDPQRARHLLLEVAGPAAILATASDPYPSVLTD
jgi:hypothetical protein